MSTNKYSVFLTMLKLYRNYLERMDGMNSCSRYMLQRSLLDQIKEDASNIMEADFTNKQEFIAFIGEKEYIEEEIIKTNEILEKEFYLRID